MDLQKKFTTEITLENQGAFNPPSATKRTSKLDIVKEWFLILFLVIFVFAIYSNSLNAPYFLDDHTKIVKNTKIHITSLSVDNLLQAAFKSRMPSRPVANISFSINYLIHKLNLLGFHLTNITIHILNGILLYFLIKATLSLPNIKKRYGPPGWTPFLTALIWLINPLHIQSVTYIVQRVNSLAAMFYLLSLLCYVHGRLNSGQKKLSLFVLAFFSGLFSIGCKEMTIVLPIFIAAYEIYFFQDLKKGALKTAGFVSVAFLALLIVMSFVYLGESPIRSIIDGYSQRSFTLEQRLLTESRVILVYLGLLFLPHPSKLALSHDFPLSNSFISPLTTTFSIVIIGALIFYAFRNARRQPLLSFCIFWYFGNIFIESSFIPLEIIFEHRSYLPSMMVIFMVVFISRKLHTYKFIQYSLLVIVIVLSANWTYARNTVWIDHVSFWRDNVEKYPLSPRANGEYGTALSYAGKSSDALKQYMKVVELDPENALAYRNIGYNLFRIQKTEQAIESYKKALAIEQTALTHYRLSTALMVQGKYDEAYIHCLKALLLEPKNIQAQRRLEVLKSKFPKSRQ